MKYKNAVQRTRAAYVEADFSDLPSGTGTEIGIELPPGAVVLGGSVLVLTASDAGTSETLKLGTSSDDAAYASVSDSKSAGRTAVSAATAPTSGAVKLLLKRTAVGTAATKGTYGVAVEYVLAGASDGTQG